MIDELTTYNLLVKYPNIADLVREAEKMARADAIEEYRKEMHDIIEGNENFIDWQKAEILECNELVAEQLKEKRND